MFRIARLVAAKDLRIELRSRVVTNQVLPFSALVMVLFAFALDREDIGSQVAPGLIWLAAVLSLLVVVQRTFALEAHDGALDALRVAGVDQAGIFLGKALALVGQLLVLEALLLGMALILFEPFEATGAGDTTTVTLGGLVLLGGTIVLATTGLAFVGTLYGGLAAGVRGRETLLPLLLMPVVAPVLIAATRATEAAFGTGETATSEGWPWLGMLAIYTAVFGTGGILAFGPLIEE
jgi:heme exporter protein B